MNTYTLIILIAFSILFGAVAPRGDVFADTINVSNNTNVMSNTSVSADSGGNSSSSEEGQSTVSVESYTVINGKTVESFSKKVESTGGEPVSIQYENTISTSTGSTSSNVKSSSKASANAKGVVKTISPTKATSTPAKASSWKIIPWGSKSASTLNASSSSTTVTEDESSVKSQSRTSFGKTWNAFWFRTKNLFNTLFTF